MASARKRWDAAAADVRCVGFQDNTLAMHRILVLLIILVATQADAAPQKDHDLERCIYLNSKIEHYTRLRRGGGAAGRMERWRQSRARYEEEFRDRRCHRFGRKLRSKKR